MQATSAYDGIVQNLVTQFSSALDCFRELVQNAIDAGTPRVEVWMEYIPGEGAEGVIAIHVDDFGEGMDAAVIDNQFTRLFESSKEGDLTKIGKFGIGFVSVFALEPHAVLVHTGKNGEYWEVLFHADRSFTTTRLDVPVEGTQITLFLRGEHSRYVKLATDIPNTLRHWCSHSDVEVTFEDRTNNRDFAPPELINEAFAVPAECLQHVVHQGTEIVLGYSLRPLYGFYNRGLTLALTHTGDDILGSRAGRFGHIAFKIKSRYLEHTLARESVMRDEQFEKAMALIEEAADGVLFDALLARLEELVALEHWGIEQITEYERLLVYLGNEPDQNLQRAFERPIVRLLSGGATTAARLYEVHRRDGRVLVSDAPDELTRRLEEMDIPVVFDLVRVGRAAEGGDEADPWRGAGGIANFLAQAFVLQYERSTRGRALRVMRQAVGTMLGGSLADSRAARSNYAFERPEHAYFPVVPDEAPPEAHAALVQDTERLLREATGSAYRRLTTGRLLASVDDAPLFGVAPRLGPLMAVPPKGGARHGERQKLEVVVNRDHLQFRTIQAAYASDRALGTYMLARALLLEQGRMIELDMALITRVLAPTVEKYSRERRNQVQTSQHRRER